MGLNETHPLYAEYLPDWQTMEDTFAGERRVKEQGTRYLPATSGMRQDGMNPGQAGYEAYQAYKTRARFPDLVEDAVAALLGVMHRKPATYKLPARLEGMIERATLQRESLEVLHRRINEEQILYGRLGLMGDIKPRSAPGGEDMPHLVNYKAKHCINWDDGRAPEDMSLNLVVLDESTIEREIDFAWKTVQIHRVLLLGDLLANEPVGGGTYQVGVFRESLNFNPEALIEPSYRGMRLDRIPFEFINACDVTAEPDKPPLLGLAQLALAIYRGEADYRQSLFMQGQDTLVIIGGTLDGASGEENAPPRVGAGGRIDIPANDGDAKYIGVSSQGLPEQRMALENDYRRGREKAGQLLDTASRDRESGEALKIRMAANTATLTRIALAGAFGLESVLRHLAAWVGANPDEVEITPNLDFVDDTMLGRELLDLMAAKSAGAPHSLRSIHANMVRRGLTEQTFEEELEEIQKEAESEFERARQDSRSRNQEGPMPDELEDLEEGEEADEEAESEEAAT